MHTMELGRCFHERHLQVLECYVRLLEGYARNASAKALSTLYYQQQVQQTNNMTSNVCQRVLLRRPNALLPLSPFLLFLVGFIVIFFLSQCYHPHLVSKPASQSYMDGWRVGRVWMRGAPKASMAKAGGSKLTNTSLQHGKRCSA